MYNIEEIPDESFVFRQATPSQRSKVKGAPKRRFPNESHFELREGEVGLSVNWDKYIDVEGCYILIALTNSKKGRFLPYQDFRVFKYPVKLLRSFDFIDDVVHKPEFRGDPAPVGKPNNQSHSEIIYEDDIEFRLKLSAYCQENLDFINCDFDFSSIEDKVEKLRERLDNTEYHRLNSGETK